MIWFVSFGLKGNFLSQSNSLYTFEASVTAGERNHKKDLSSQRQWYLQSNYILRDNM